MFFICPSLPSLVDVSVLGCDDRTSCSLDRTPFHGGLASGAAWRVTEAVSGVPPPRLAAGTPEAVPQSHEPVRRDDDDDQEDQADDRVEAAADHGQLDVADIVVDDDEGEGADPGALDPGEAADDGDHEQLDRGGQADVAGRDLPVPPDEEHAGERRRRRTRTRTRACGAAARCSRVSSCGPGRPARPAARARTASGSGTGSRRRPRARPRSAM